MRLYEMMVDDLDDFTAMLRSKYKPQDLWLYRSGDPARNLIILDSIVISKDQRKQGIGSKIMQEITDYADMNELRIGLTPGSKDDHHGTTSHGRLVKFYKRFGFKQNKGRHANYSISAGMIRNPQ